MSLRTRQRIRNVPYIWDSLTLQEKEEQMAWCPITDELIRQAYPGQDVDEVVDKMDENELNSLVSRALRIYHERQKKKGKKKSKEQEEAERKGEEEREAHREKETVEVRE